MTGLVAVPGFQDFAFAGGGDVIPYAIVCSDTSQWEVGYGVHSGGSLTRSTVLSSNTGALVNFGAGTKDVFCTLPAASTVTNQGGTFAGHIAVPAGASGVLVPRAQEIGNLAIAQRPDAYLRTNILGTVSHAGGVPTGAILDTIAADTRLSIRYANGTQVEHAVLPSTYTVSTPLGSLFYAFAPYSNFLRPFSVVPTVQVSVANSGGAPCWGGTGSASTTQAINMYMHSTTSGATGQFSYIAIGRWF
jgi:hypothetical protein